MVDIVNTKCDIENCEERAYFSYEGDKPSKCRKHALSYMIRVENRKCLFENCTITPSYLPLFSNIAIHCVNHASLNEYSYNKRNPKCITMDCDEPAYYFHNDDINIYPVRCIKHKLETDIQLMKQKCPNCNDTLYFPENREYCMNCAKYREIKLFHYKETIVKEFLRTVNIEFIYNKQIRGGLGLQPGTPEGSLGILYLKLMNGPLAGEDCVLFSNIIVMLTRNIECPF